MKKLYAQRVKILIAITTICFMGLGLIGCNSKKVITTLAVDRSKSNVNVDAAKNKNNRKFVKDICKTVVLEQKSIDTLTLKEFDSETSPAKNGFLEQPNDVKRDNFISENCDKLAADYSESVLPGTSIQPVWAEFFKTYKQRKEDKQKNDGSNISSESTDVYIFFVDALEDVPQIKNQDADLKHFKSSIKEFIEDGNFLLIFVVDKKDREKLMKSLSDVMNLPSNQDNKLDIVDVDNFESKIENIYKMSRKQKK